MGWTAVPVFAAAVVLLAAGVGKVARPAGTAAAMGSAGLPSSTVLAQLLGVGEIAIGVAAFVWGNRLTSGLVALAYLGFACFAALLLARHGRTASCGCFGERNAPVHPLHVGVNIVVAGLAAAGVAVPTGSVADLHGVGAPVGVLGGALVVAALVYGLLAVLPARLATARSERDLTAATGTGPALTGTRLDGRATSVALDASAAGTVLAFLSSSCLGCRPFWESLGARPHPVELPADVPIVIVTKDEPEDDRAALSRLAPAGVDVIASSDAWAAFGVPGSPYFVLVDGSTGRPRARDTASTWDDVVDRLNLVVDPQRR